MEAKLQKLKVTELKELLAKNHLVQTGKKDDLIKRLLDNHVSIDDEAEELDEPPPTYDAGPASSPANALAPPTETPDGASAPAPTTSDLSPDLSPEQQAMKARAERFGIAFNPNPTTRPPKETASVPIPAKSSSTPTTAKTAAPPATAPKKTAIDSAPLGISDEVLAKRAAKFGLPEKKAAENSNGTDAKAESVAVAEKKAEVELTPEAAARQAEEEEKKRKRAAKFGTVKPPTNGTSEPDAKKTKV